MNYCQAEIYPQTRETPRELCENEVTNGTDLCDAHEYTDQDAADDAREHDRESRLGY